MKISAPPWSRIKFGQGSQQRIRFTIPIEVHVDHLLLSNIRTNMCVCVCATINHFRLVKQLKASPLGGGRPRGSSCSHRSMYRNVRLRKRHSKLEYFFFLGEHMGLGVVWWGAADLADASWLLSFESKFSTRFPILSSI